MNMAGKFINPRGHNSNAGSILNSVRTAGILPINPSIRRIIRAAAVAGALLAPHAFAAADSQPADTRPASAALVTVDLSHPGHVMAGGIGTSWHAMGPTVVHYPDLIGRDNRACKGSAYGGNPPLTPAYDKAWADLLGHARWLGLDFIRVEVGLDMWEPQRETFTWDTAEMKTLYRILDYCQANQVDVYLSMMWQGVAWNAHPGICMLQSSPRSVADFSNGYATLIEKLVKDKGYTCIHWATVSNEPGMDVGWWTGADRKPDSIMPEIHAVRAALDQRGLKDIALCGSDGHRITSGQSDPSDPALGALSIHDYGGSVNADKYQGEVKLARERKVPFFVAEFGRFFMAEFEGDQLAMGGPRSATPKAYGEQLLNAHKVLQGLNNGVDGFSRWSFVNRGDLDGQWQMVRTWHPNRWDFYKEVKPEPVPYFSYGILTRFAAKHSTVLLSHSDQPDLIATTLLSPKGGLTVYLLNLSEKTADTTISLAGVTGPILLHAYQVTEAGLQCPDFTLAASSSQPVNAQAPSFAVSLPAKSITAYSTFLLAADAPGITQE